MKWIWQLEDWTQFTYEEKNLSQYEQKFLDLSGQVLGALNHIEKEGRVELQIDIIRNEALQTSEIEGEYLDKDSVQSSLLNQFGLKVPRKNHLLKEKGISELLASVYQNWNTPLSHDLLKSWHYTLFQKQREDAGCYRAYEDAMQVVSGSIENPKVHYEAPPSSQVSDEIEHFIQWYNEAHHKKSPAPLAIAAIAHLWFESIHPFEDGNGRIGRAIAEKSLSQSLGRPALISLSTAIQNKKKGYYTAFSLTQSGEENNITEWMNYFLPLVIEAQKLSLKTIEFVIQKAQLLQTHQAEFNERQNKVILRMLSHGINGFSGGLSAKNYASISKSPPSTVTRDLQDLVQKGVLTKTGELKNTRYFLNLWDPMF